MKRFIENRPSSDTARRPLPPLAGNLLFLGALFAMSLLVMAIEKPLFLLWYHAQAAEASAAELARVVWNGLKLDQTVAGYITALPLLVVLAAIWIPGRWSRSVLKGYLLVIAAVAATAFAPVVLGGSGSRKEQGDNQKSKCFHKPNKIWFFG